MSDNGDEYDWPDWLIGAILNEEGIEEPSVTGRSVASPGDSCLMIGPPGAGKTMEQSFRASLRVVNEGLDPQELTYATFRRSQAEELRLRLTSWGVVDPRDAEVVPGSEDDPFRWWGTAHAVAGRASGFIDANLGRGDHDGDMFDKSAMEAFCKQNDVSFSWRATQTTEWSTFRRLYAYSKNNLLDAGEYRNVPDNKIRPLRSDPRASRLLQEFHDEWPATDQFEDWVSHWETWKRQNQVNDFWEMLESGLSGPLPGTKHVAIDEMHDATPLMSLLFERWVDEADVAVISGDPNQVINSFSGAHETIFTELSERVDAKLPTIHLQDSHRCGDEHFSAASLMLRRGGGSPPDLQTAGPGPIYRYKPSKPISQTVDGKWQVTPQTDPASPIALWREHAPDLLMLARMQWQLNAIGSQLDEHGIIYTSQDGVAGDWDRRLAVMRAVRELENNDNVDPTNIVSLDLDDAFIFFDHVDQRSVSDTDGLNTFLEECRIENEQVSLNRLDEFVTDSFWHRYSRGVDSIAELTGYDRFTDRDFRAMRAAWQRYQDLSTWEIRALSGVRLWTIHAAKGAEASDVVVWDGVSRRISDAVNEFEEDRLNEARTWYVALTRSSQRLHIVRSGFAALRSDDAGMESFLADDLEQRSAVLAAQYRSTGVVAAD